MINHHKANKLIDRCAPPPYSRFETNKKPLKCKRDNIIEKKIKFRCDFPASTQAKVMLSRGWFEIKLCDGENVNDWNLWWCDINEVRFALDVKLDEGQKIPHFRNHYELTRKNYLCRNLKRYKKLLIKEGKTLEAKLCECMPITFELPNEYHMLVDEYHRNGGTWIVKPAARSQGKGIFLFKKLKDLVDWKKKESTDNHHNRVTGENVNPETYVVQKYVDDPYLLAGRKFDLRIYVLVTSFNPLKVWLAREGFARLSGQLYNLKKINDSRVHLTNMSIQLKLTANDYCQGSTTNQGCKWALRKVREYLTAKHGVKVMEKLLQRIAGVIMASLQSVKTVIMQGKNSFELYGYDVLLDRHLTPWLLEVNASPALAPTDNEDYRLKFDLLDDVLTILDFDRILTGRETRVGGFDLLWDEGPVWTNCPGVTHSESKKTNPLKRLNIFLGSENDRISQLQRLRNEIKFNRKKK